MSRICLLGSVLMVIAALALRPTLAQNAPMSTNLIGLPEHNVLLVGEPSAPILVNNSDRGIIAYTIRWTNSTGPSFTQIKVSFLNIRHSQPSMIPAKSQRTVDRDQTLVSADGQPPGPAIGAILDAVIFEDGEVVGPDNAHALDMVSTRMKAEQDVHQKVLAANANSHAAVWDDISRMVQNAKARNYGSDPRYTRMQATFAQEVLDVRDKQGEAAAIELAKSSAKYPKIWRKQ